MTKTFLDTKVGIWVLFFLSTCNIFLALANLVQKNFQDAAFWGFVGAVWTGIFILTLRRRRKRP